MDIRTDRRTERRTDIMTDRRTDTRTDRRTDIRTDRKTDIRTDRRMDGRSRLFAGRRPTRFSLTRMSGLPFSEDPGEVYKDE